MTSLVNIYENNLDCQKDELFEYIFKINSFTRGSTVILNEDLDITDVLKNILKMKLIAQELLNYLSKTFCIKESKEYYDGERSLPTLEIFKKEPNIILDTNEQDMKSLNNTKDIEQNLSVNKNVYKSEKDYSKQDSINSIELDFIKKETDLDPDTMIETTNNIVNNTECGVCFKSYSVFSIKIHMRTAHGVGSKVLQCELCGKRHATKARLDHHMKTIHTKEPIERNITCQECGKGFANCENLAIHKRTIHGSKNATSYHFCMVCNKQFSTISQLKAHKNKTHKMLKCEECEKVLQSNAAFIKHMKIHAKNNCTRNESDPLESMEESMSKSIILM